MNGPTWRDWTSTCKKKKKKKKKNLDTDLSSLTKLSQMDHRPKYKNRELQNSEEII